MTEATFFSSDSSTAFEYEVFLSFRGPDTRAGFTDFLYTSLIKSAVRVYRDDEELREGEEIGGELLKAINQSKVSLPIFSKGYASSGWCLKELVQMLKCKKSRGQRIIPIFYDVEPSEVRYQTGEYGNAILAHQQKKRFDEQTINEWKAALNEVGALKGLHLQRMTNRHEGEFADMVVKMLVIELKKAYLVVTDSLIGVDNHVEEIMRLIGEDKKEVQVVGIYGIGGVGKTTLAKVIYNQLSSGYESCCFLANISETALLKGIEAIQCQLISDVLKIKWPQVNNMDEGMKMIKERLSAKKTLVLLDDVGKRSILNALIGVRDWFGEGSRIIITTRNRDVLTAPVVTWTYEHTGMNFDQSLRLFCRHAFRADYPPNDYVDFAVKAVNIAGGLPLVIEIVGSLLSSKARKEWDSILNRLKKVPHGDVGKRLKLSFDALEEQQKQIFLDVACFFIGVDIRIVRYMWDDTDLFPGEGIEVLQQMSLIKIENECNIRMHDQLRDLGREIVRQDCLMKPEKQSRIWNLKEARQMIISGKGTEQVEGLRLICNPHYSFPKEELLRLSNIRFLEVISYSPAQDFKYYLSALLSLQWASKALPLKLLERKPVSLSKLRWLSWHDFSVDLNLNIRDFSLWNLVILDLSRSRITEKWAGWRHIEMARKLKVLNLTGCCSLKTTPDFSSYTSLERLILESCTGMVEVDRSICKLMHLTYLNLNRCFSLGKLPDEMSNLEALTELLLNWTKVQVIPGLQGMKSLQNLCVDDCRCFGEWGSICCSTSLERLSLNLTGIASLPNSIGLLVNLKYLSLSRCDLREKLPDSIGDLISLVHLDLSRTQFDELPDSIGNLKNLKALYIGWSLIKKLPSAIGRLKNLEVLDAEFCWQLEGDIPDEIGRLQSLVKLKLTSTRISCIPMLPESLTFLEVHSLSMKSFPDLSNLVNLRELTLKLDGYLKNYSEPFQDPTPWWLGKLRQLESLELSSTFMVTLPSDISLLTKLKRLYLIRCYRLRCLPIFPLSLSSLLIEECGSINISLDLSNVTDLKELTVQSSEAKEIIGLEGLKNLRRLDLKFTSYQGTVLDLSNSNMLSELRLVAFCNLIEIQGRLESLEKVCLSFCPSLEKFDALSILKKQPAMRVISCPRLQLDGVP